MASVFLQLKLRLLANRYSRLARGATAARVVIYLLLLVLGVGIALGLSLLRGSASAGPVITTVFVAQFVGWALTPLVAFGVDETVDPRRFALLPIRRRQLLRGLLLSSLIGIMPLVNLVVLIGAAIGGAGTLWTLPLGLVAGVVQLLLCILVSRALSTSMSSLLSGRRGRDIGVFAGFAVFVLYMLLNFVLQSSSGMQQIKTVDRIGDVLAFTPPGALARLPILAGEGRWGLALLVALYALAFAALLGFWWSAALHRSLTTESSTTQSSAQAGTDPDGGLVERLVPGVVGLMMARDLKMSWRDPMRRVPLLMALFLGLVWPFLVVRGDHGRVFAVAFGALLFGTVAGNQFGMDGSAIWQNLVSLSTLRRAKQEIWGHVLATLLPGIVLLAVCALVHVTIQGDWDLLPSAAGLLISGLGGGLAAATLTSAYLPYGQPQQRRSIFASSAPEQRGRAGVTVLLAIVLAVAVMVPAGVCVALTLLVTPVFGLVGLLVGVVAGVAAVVTAVQLAARRYLATGPEILTAARVGDGA